VPFTQVHFSTLPNPKFAGKTGCGDPRAIPMVTSGASTRRSAVDGEAVKYSEAVEGMDERCHWIT